MGVNDCLAEGASDGFLDGSFDRKGKCDINILGDIDGLDQDSA